jgi:hypothetical protein
MSVVKYQLPSTSRSTTSTLSRPEEILTTTEMESQLSRKEPNQANLSTRKETSSVKEATELMMMEI